MMENETSMKSLKTFLGTKWKMKFRVKVFYDNFNNLKTLAIVFKFQQNLKKHQNFKTRFIEIPKQNLSLKVFTSFSNQIYP